MHPTSRWVEQLERDIPGVRSLMDPEAAAAQRAQRSYRFNAFQVPLLRCLGLSLVAFLVYLHNCYILANFSWQSFGTLVLFFGIYGGVSWLFLVLTYSRTSRYDTGDWVYATDVIVWTIAIYAAGGEQSWLFFFM